MRKWLLLFLGLDVLSFVAALLWGPVPGKLAWGSLISYKILYMHVPLSWAMFLALGTTVFAGAMFLKTRSLRWDAIAGRALVIGLASGTAGILMGAFWSKEMSGVYWPWEPKSTAVLLVILLYAGLLVLRASITDKEKRASVSAAYASAGIVLVPLTFASTALFGGTHGYLHQEPFPGMTYPFLLLRVITTSLVVLAFSRGVSR